MASFPQLICSQPVNVDSMRTMGESVLEALRKKDKKRKGSTRQDTCLTFTPACVFIAMKEVSLRIWCLALYTS